jgi:hypothetical protein
MQTSSAIRAEAKKLFWSSPDAWYYVDGNWVLGGAFPGLTHIAMEFLAYVEQIQVDGDLMRTIKEWWKAGMDKERFHDESGFIEGQIFYFWQTLQRLFPRATRVVISESHPQVSIAPLPPGLKRVVQMCPPGITASASFVRHSKDHDRKVERSLWQRTGEDASAFEEWKETAPLWTRESILIPPKQFGGPVGEYAGSSYKFTRFCQQNDAARLLRIESIDRHCFSRWNGPFGCLKQGCGLEFRKLGDWSLHALQTLHDKDVSHPDEALRVLFEQKKERLEYLFQDIREAWDRMYEAWGEEGSQKQQSAEQAFLYQLDNDALYAQGRPARESDTWHGFVPFTRPGFQTQLKEFPRFL